MKVSSLPLNPPLSIHPSVTVQKTLKLLKHEGLDQVPIIDETGLVPWSLHFTTSHSATKCGLKLKVVLKWWGIII